MIGGYLVVIANCPSCGTHYKHEAPEAPARGRCGRCDATLDLTRLRPYRIVPVAPPDPADTARAARHLPIGLDHPALATTIARNLERSPASAQPVVAYRIVEPTLRPVVEFELQAAPVVGQAPAESWDEDDPLPAIPEMAIRGAFEPSVPPVLESDILDEAESEPDDDTAHRSSGGTSERATTFALWLAAGAIVGTGASWTLGGTTMVGILAGGALGAVTGWGWLRWMSPK